jgi:hypothetical protein
MKFLVQCPLYDSVLEEILSLKQCTLDTWSVRAICVYLQCKLDYALFCCYTPFFNPSASSPLNHITKIVSITLTTVRRNGIQNILEVVKFLTKCGQNSSSQHSSDSVFALCFVNSSFRLTNSICSLATCVLMPSLQSRCAWKDDSMRTLSSCLLLRSNHAQNYGPTKLYVCMHILCTYVCMYV